MTDTPIKAYKGFDADMKCRGFQFKVGETYEHDGDVKACVSGFHACTSPTDVFYYYSPGTSRFAEVALSGSTDTKGIDSKVAAAVITVSAEIDLSEMIQAAIKFAFDAGEWEEGASASGNRGAASASGDRGVASASGYEGTASASGNRGAASASGNRGVASASGERSTVAALGRQSKAKAENGCALLLVERRKNDSIASVFAGIVGEGGLKPDTWYTCVNGEAIEVEE